MSTQTNKETIKRLLDAHFSHDKARVSEILSSKLVWYMTGMDKAMNRDDYLNGLDVGKRAFSEMKNTIESMIAEGDRVAVLGDVRMRHTGPFLDIAPTNREVKFPYVWMYRLVDAKVVEAWAFNEDFTAKLRAP